jgi:hypothetical protein
MSPYTVIEDCSPYYIRFTWDKLPELINFIKTQPIDPAGKLERAAYTHYSFDDATAQQIVNQLPMKQDFVFDMIRVSLFITPPGGKSTIHKDGLDNRMSINIPILILDNKCTTAWYTDESVSHLEQANDDYSRVVVAKGSVTPIKQMIAQSNECILFNTDIYHLWDNQSKNTRIVLTLRDMDHGNLHFEDAKKKLFGY